MPLYMEFHKAQNLSVQNLKEKAEAASDILRGSSVRYLQLWLNEEAGTVFCLIQGPNRAICEAIHKSIYGIDVEGFTHVKECFQIAHDHEVIEYPNNLSRVRHGYFLAVFNTATRNEQIHTADEFNFRTLSRTIIEARSGICVDVDHSQCVQACFSSALNALDCAVEIQSKLLASHIEKFRIALLPAFMPKDDSQHDLSFCRANQMQSISSDSVLIVASQLQQTLGNLKRLSTHIRVLSAQEEAFLDLLFRIMTNHLQDDRFNVDGLSKYAGISRPQLYRRVHTLTGRSPNSFMRDLRMERALDLLRQRNKNICEIAFEVGYANPSYFARTFAQKYGCTPSVFMSTL